MDKKEYLVRNSIKNSTFSFLGSIAGVFISLFIAGYSIRRLGEGLSGFIMLTQSILVFSSGFFSFGLGPTAIKEISSAIIIKDDEKIQKVIEVTTFVNFALAIIIALAFAIFAYKIFIWSKLSMAYETEAVISCYFYAATFAIGLGLNSYTAVMPAFQRYDFVSIQNTTNTLFTNGIQALILIYFPSILKLSIGIFVAAIINSIILIILTRKLLGKIYLPKWDYKVFKGLINFSSYMFFTQCGYLERDYIDRWMLNGLKGAVTLPGYVIGQSLINKIRGFLNNIVHFVFPMFSSESQVIDKEKLFIAYDKLEWIITFSATFIFSLAAINAHWILAHWITSDFAVKYSIILQIACLQGVISVLTIIPYFACLGLNKPANILVEAIITGNLVVVFAIILLPSFGILGLAIGQLLTNIIASIVFLYLFKRNIYSNIKFSRILNPALPALVLNIPFIIIAIISNLNKTYSFYSFSIIQILDITFISAYLLYILFEKKNLY